MSWDGNLILLLAFLGFFNCILIHAIPVGCNKDDEPPVDDPTTTLDLDKSQ